MFEPLVLVVTVRLPVGAVQLTENDVDAVPPAGTLTVRDGPPLTEQLLATPDSTTVWLAAESPVNVTLPFVPIDLLAFPSTVTVYPSLLMSEPLVPVVTVRSPVVGGGGGA